MAGVLAVVVDSLLVRGAYGRTLVAVEKTRSIRNVKPRYETSDGEWVPGVTTIIGLRAKDALVGWAFGVGKSNPDLKSIYQYTDELAEIGSAAHAIIGAHLKGVDPDLSDFTPNTVQAAGVPVMKFMEWKLGHKFELIASEKSYVSDKHRFGGTLDVLAKIDGQVTVLDIKTGKSIFPEHFFQCAAYAELVAETGLRPDAIRILQIGRVGSEGFTERTMTEWSLHWRWFLAMREVYEIERLLDRKVVSLQDASLESKLRASVKLLEVKKANT
jgi:hypothetical protein